MVNVHHQKKNMLRPNWLRDWQCKKTQDSKRKEMDKHNFKPPRKNIVGVSSMNLYFKKKRLKIFSSTYKPSTAPQRGNRAFLKEGANEKKLLRAQLFGLFLAALDSHCRHGGFTTAQCHLEPPLGCERQGIRRPGDQTGRVCFLTPPATCPGSNLPTRTKIHGI